MPSKAADDNENAVRPRRFELKTCRPLGAWPEQLLATQWTSKCALHQLDLGVMLFVETCDWLKNGFPRSLEVIFVPFGRRIYVKDLLQHLFLCIQW